MIPFVSLLNDLQVGLMMKKSILKKPEILMRSRFYVEYTNLLFPGITENLETFIIYNPYCLCGLSTSAKGKNRI